jgi:hypothetical protein
MNIELLKRLETYLKQKDGNNQIIGKTLPDIRYFDGIELYCDAGGNYKASTLEGSLDLFLKSINL